MLNYNLGYACINTELSSRKVKVSTNRTMRRKTFDEKGLDYVSEIILQNVTDLLTILKWNAENDIHFFRMSSEMFPWASEYALEDLKDFDKIEEALFKAGLFAEEHDIRLTTHPGPFNKLCSPNEQVVQNTIRDLEIHGKMMDLLCQPRSPWAKINIHVGGAYNDKPMALGNFCRNFGRLSEAVRSRLTVENDDKESLYSTKELYDGIFKELGIPIVPLSWLFKHGVMFALWFITVSRDHLNTMIQRSSHKPTVTLTGNQSIPMVTRWISCLRQNTKR